ncbi:lipid IV(A) 3-deoxy-D-manno-octulosonic acid transferase [Candidatus Profftia tarda]|uniref:lipid IV(A) 3-deoxy-D-manno-octulosonic acid transferase n=1 Tax=Candidatus Profftia tarda TaxID=1177216 RepID=UPI001C1FC98C|nr:lipid IV(A) 3-deoxy-D-manno-octulosonic acid transferase [Candidatus Profftia tarda]
MLQRLYTILFYIIQPLIWIKLWMRGSKDPAYRKRWAERYGFCSKKMLSGGIMLHLVSVGEIFAAIPLVKELLCRYPTFPLTITTMTPTGSERIQSLFNQEVQHVYLPYDLPGSINRFLEQFNPRLVLIMETEIWPNLIIELSKRQIPLVIVNARLSALSAKRYSRIYSLISDTVRRITLICAQNEADAERFLSLGVLRSQLSITGNLKFEISVTPDLAAKAVRLRHKWGLNCPVWIATSTHKGEEKILIEAHKQLLNRFTDLLLILVPRHPERFDDVIELTRGAGLSYVTRSSGNRPSPKTQVIIGNTMGELMLLYGVADLAFVGGSLVEQGGHNPLEPSAYAIPVLMGPHTINFREICSKLEQANGLIIIRDTASLVKEVTTLLLDKECRRQHGRYAIEVLNRNKGSLQNILYFLEPILQKIK